MIMRMKSFNYSCQGESHKLTNKVCQDYSYSEVDPQTGIAIAVVCDGHGSDPYFRSHIGARLTTEITVEAVKEFVKEINYISEDCKPLFAGHVFTQIGVAHHEALEQIAHQTPQEKAFRQMTMSIIKSWYDAIGKDAEDNPLTEWELEHVPSEIQEKFKEKVSSENKAGLEEHYGCTLMAIVVVPEDGYWFGLHLGDGKCLIVDDSYKMCEPIPWDDKCFQNYTTSMCEEDAANDFRFCYQGNGHFPIAAFLGSDGIDDSYGDGELLHEFYIKIVKTLLQDGYDSTKTFIEELLPIVSKNYSQDDMSVSILYDDEKLQETAIALNRQMIETRKLKIESLMEKLLSLKEKEEIANQSVKRLKDAVNSVNRQLEVAQRDALYAEKDVERTENELNNLRKSVEELISFGK